MKKYSLKKTLLTCSLTIVASLSYQMLYSQEGCEKGKVLLDGKSYKDAAEQLLLCRTTPQYKLLYVKSVYYWQGSPKHRNEEAIKVLNSFDKSMSDYEEAQYYFGLYYKDGKGVKQNLDSARIYFENALKIPRANLELIDLYEKIGQEYYPPKFLTPIAMSNDNDISDNEKANAMYRLGIYYFKKSGETSEEKKQEENLDDALDWYKRAENLNSTIDIELGKKIKTAKEDVLSTSIWKEVTLQDKNGKKIANKTVDITGTHGLTTVPTNGDGKCRFQVTMRQKTENPEIKIKVNGYKELPYNLKEPAVSLIPNNIWSKLADPSNEGKLVTFAIKGGWGANKMTFGSLRDIEPGLGNQYNIELNMIIGKRFPILAAGIAGFQSNSYPFSKIDKYYYENLSFKSVYFPFGLKCQVFGPQRKFHFLYLHCQVNLGYNFGATYKNYLLDYEMKDNKIIEPFHAEMLIGLTLMKKGWFGIEVNYGFMTSALNKDFKQTINDIEFKPFDSVYTTPQCFSVNGIVFIDRFISIFK